MHNTSLLVAKISTHACKEAEESWWLELWLVWLLLSVASADTVSFVSGQSSLEQVEEDSSMVSQICSDMKQMCIVNCFDDSLVTGFSVVIALDGGTRLAQLAEIASWS